MLTLALTLAVALSAAPEPTDYDAIMAGVGAAPLTESARRMEAWVEAHGDDPRAPMGLLWSGQLRLRARDEAGATLALRRLVERWPDAPLTPDARLLLADLAVEAHRFDEAFAGYDAVEARGDERLRYLAAEHRREAHAAQTRFFASWAVALALLVVAGLRLRTALLHRTLWPLPEEFWHMLPVALLFALSTLRQGAQEQQAVLTLAAFGLGLAWLTGAAFRASPPRGARRWLEAALGLAQAAGALFITIESSRLWNRVVDTIAMGVP